MSVYFRELAGSPIEWYDSDGFHAKRTFITKWEDRDAFAIELLGEAAAHGGSLSTCYPGKTHVFAATLRYEPFDPNYIDQKTLESLTDDVNSYSNSYAKATVEYDTINSMDREDGPSNETGTHLTYKMLYSGEYLTIGSGGWSWSDTSTSIPSDQALTKWVPMTEHLLTWQSVVNPPWTAIHNLQGTVNDSEFLSCPAGTVLFEGAEANKLYSAGFEEGASPFCWQIKYMFRERSIKSNGSTYGWNHAYRETPAGWAEVTNGSTKLYDSADLMTLFQSETS